VQGADNMKKLDISKGADTPITLSLKVLVSLVVILITAYGAMFTTFVTKAQAADITSKIDSLTKEVRVSSAYARVGYYQQNVGRMKSNGDSQGVIEQEERRLKLSVEYRDCLLNEKPNCELIAEQIK